jgi:adenosylcobinamide-phosphate guanylyltransferase
MLALIMAGGEGTRLNLGEKPLLDICGRPMISYVIDAFVAADCEPVVVTSFRTPMTRNWCRAQGITIQNAGGSGYIEDMVESVTALEESGPLFISVSDIPCVSPETIRSVQYFHAQSGKDACSTWIPASSVHGDERCMPYRENVDGIEACPAGMNIMTGARIACPQEEARMLVNDPGLSINVNTRENLLIAVDYLQSVARNCQTR